jgi:two-component system sensor kinase
MAVGSQRAMRLPAFIRQVQQLPRSLVFGFLFAMALLLVLGEMSYRNIRDAHTAANWVSRTDQTALVLKDIFSSVQDAESAQRAFTMSGVEAYLAPYNNAIQALPGELAHARQLISDNPVQVAHYKQLHDDIDARLALIKERIGQRRDRGVNALDAALLQGEGMRLMDAVRVDVAAMIAEEDALLDIRLGISRRASLHAIAFQNAAGFVSLAVLLVVFFNLARQMLRANRAELEAQRVNAQLRDANNEMRSFSYSVAHDLRSPLRAINGFAQVLLEDCAGALNDEGRRALGRITANATTMGQLIDDLLALSKVSYQPLRSVRVDMGELVRSAYQEILEAHPGRQIDFEVGPLPPAAGDPLLLRQAWLNLIGNALKFTRSRARASIEIGGNVAGPEFATYYIRDNGAGFDMQYASKIFGAFQRLHRPGAFEGTGIGLALVQRIVQRHGGTIWAEGKENEGARFAFTLPEWSEEERMKDEG